jgi:hypothetical protein
MDYQIRVTKRGVRYFTTDGRTAPHSISQAIDVAMHFKEVFPERDGYKVSLTESTRNHIALGSGLSDGPAKEIEEFTTEQIANVFWDFLSKAPNAPNEHEERRMTQWGTKTKLGLVLTMNRLTRNWQGGES